MLDLQGTYQYWGAKLFSYFHAAVAQRYLFKMQVDSAARLWVNGTLVINATCTKQYKSMCSATLQPAFKNASNLCCCCHETIFTSLRGTAADHSGSFSLLMHSDVATHHCLHTIASTNQDCCV